MSKAGDIVKMKRLMEGRDSLWIVGQIRDDGRWDFQGVFVDELGAVGACRNQNYFIAPATMNESLRDETDQHWPGLYFPLAKVTA